jgi:hypothetical protein
VPSNDLEERRRCDVAGRDPGVTIDMSSDSARVNFPGGTYLSVDTLEVIFGIGFVGSF